jgi:hypothetical protein
MIEWPSGRKATWKDWEWYTEDSKFAAVLERLTKLVPDNISIPDYAIRVVKSIAEWTGGKVIELPPYDKPELVSDDTTTEALISVLEGGKRESA